MNDPNKNVMVTVTHKDGHEEDITPDSFFKYLDDVERILATKTEFKEKELLEMLAKVLQIVLDFEITPAGAPPEWGEWNENGKAREKIKSIFDKIKEALANADIEEHQTADEITKFLRGEREFMTASRPRGYGELLKINRTGESGLQGIEKENIKITFPGRLSIEEQKIRQTFELALLEQNYHKAKERLSTRVYVPIDNIMDILDRPNNPNNKKAFSRRLRKDILPNIQNSYIEVVTSGNDWLKTNFGQECGVINDQIYFQFSERYAQYLNTGAIKQYHSLTLRLGSRQFPLPFYLATKMEDHYFHDGNRKKQRHNILKIKTLLDFGIETIDYPYIMEVNPNHWKREIKGKYERALNEIEKGGLFKWSYCGAGLKEIPQEKIDGADFYQWSDLYITFQFIPEELDQSGRLQRKQERIEEAREKKRLEDDRATVEADKIRKRKRKQATKNNKRQSSYPKRVK